MTNVFHLPSNKILIACRFKRIEISHLSNSYHYRLIIIIIIIIIIIRAIPKEAWAGLDVSRSLSFSEIIIIIIIIMCEEGDVTVFWNEAVHTDREVTANRPDIIIKKQKR